MYVSMLMFLPSVSAGEKLKQLEQDKGIVVRFVIGHRYASIQDSGIVLDHNLDQSLEVVDSMLPAWRTNCSATPGGILDRAIEAEDAQHSDFLRLVRWLSWAAEPFCEPLLEFYRHRCRKRGVCAPEACGLR